MLLAQRSSEICDTLSALFSVPVYSATTTVVTALHKKRQTRRNAQKNARGDINGECHVRPHKHPHTHTGPMKLANIAAQ